MAETAVSGEALGDEVLDDLVGASRIVLGQGSEALVEIAAS